MENPTVEDYMKSCKEWLSIYNRILLQSGASEKLVGECTNTYLALVKKDIIRILEKRNHLAVRANKN